MKKRILSFLLSLAMLAINASVFAQEEQPEYAQFFWDGAKNINIQGYYYSEEPEQQYMSRKKMYHASN